jgi:acetyl-CoA C-acetyltransferase
MRQATSVQAEADRNKRAVPEFLTEADGKGKVEAFTVIYRNNGEVEHGVVMLRTEDGRRTLGRIPASDEASLAHLRDMDRTPVGSVGDITMAGDGVPQWRVG